jgi:hypothetical protein
MKTHSTAILPQGYRAYDHVNLQQDKKTAVRVNIAAMAVMVLMCVIAHLTIVPFTEFYESVLKDGATMLIRLGVLFGAYAAYIVLHELTHAAVMKLFGATKLRFGFTGMYAYAGSEVDYFTKGVYFLIALAPLIVWSIILTPILFAVPREWFWVVWFIQIGNVAGAAGDVYVVLRFLRAPRDILVLDTGVEMFVYSGESK